MNNRINEAEVNAALKHTLPEASNIDELRRTLDKVLDFRNKLQVLKGKETLTAEEKLTVKQARELAEVLLTKNYAQDIYKRQSQELRDLLKSFSEEKKQVVDTARTDEKSLNADVNQQQEASKPQEKTSQKPQILPPLQKIDIAPQPSVKEIYAGKDAYATLCDINNDGEISHAGDNGMISGYQVYKVLEKNRNNPDLIKNIGLIMGVQFTTPEDLEIALKASPELKNKFFNNIHFLAFSGVDVAQVLEKGQKGLKSSVEIFAQNVTLGEQVSEALASGFDAKYNEALAKLESQLTRTDLKEEDRKKIEHLLSLYKENKQAFLDSFRLNGAAAILSFVQEKKGAAIGASVSNSQIDTFLKEKTGEIISGMTFNFGFGSSGGKFVPGLGVDFATKVFQVSENVSLNFNAGLFLNVPYGVGTLNYTYNKEDIAKAGFQDFSVDKKRIGITANVSSLGGGVMLHWNKEKLEAVQTKEKQLQELLNSVMGDDFDPIQAVTVLQANTNLSIEDKKYLEPFIVRVQEILKMIGFETLGSVHKKTVLDGLKYAFVNEWKNQVFVQAEKSGLNFTGIGIGVQFISGFLPLPTFGVRFTDYKMKYIEDKNGKIMAHMAASGLGKEAVVSTKVSSQEVNSGIEKLKNADVEAYLAKNISKFDGNNAKAPSTIAMRNPNDYPELLKSLVSGDMTRAFDYLTKILKTDVLLRNDADTKELVKKFSNLSSEQRAYILAQFMDVIFKDKNNIQTVLTSDTEWKNREKGLSGVYTDTEVYSQVVALRNKTRSEVISGKTVLPVEGVKGVMGFVASYKVGYEKGKQISLGKGEAAIPPGLATVVGGEKGITKVEDPKLISHTIDDMKKTPFYDKLKTSIASVIATKYTGFTMDANTFDGLLKTGELKIGDKTVTLNREFVFFLYGRCANETLGLRINGLDLGDGQPPLSGLDFDADGGLKIIPQSPILEKTDYAFGASVGDKKNDNNGNNNPNNPNNPNQGPGGNTTGGAGNSGNAGNSGGGNIP